MFFRKSAPDQLSQVAPWYEDFINIIRNIRTRSELCNDILKWIVKVLHAKNASLLTLDENTSSQELSFKVQASVGGEPLQSTLKATDSFVVFLRKHRQILNKQQMLTDPKWVDVRVAASRYFSLFQVDYVLPLWVEQKFIGMINLSLAQSHGPSDLMPFLASLAALCLEHAEFYQSLAKQNAENQAMARHKVGLQHSIEQEMVQPLDDLTRLLGQLLNEAAGPINGDQKRYLEMIADGVSSVRENVDLLLKGATL